MALLSATGTQRTFRVALHMSAFDLSEGGAMRRRDFINPVGQGFISNLTNPSGMNSVV
jgi:hypothetical protein